MLGMVIWVGLEEYYPIVYSISLVPQEKVIFEFLATFTFLTYITAARTITSLSNQQRRYIFVICGGDSVPLIFDYTRVCRKVSPANL
jgi:hypothetical protein